VTLNLDYKVTGFDTLEE